MVERCEQCGANLALVGRMHNCNPPSVPAIQQAVKASIQEAAKAWAKPAEMPCPVCEARRLKQREAQKRWRDKKRAQPEG